MKINAAVKKILFTIIFLLAFQVMIVTTVNGNQNDVLWYYPPTPQGDIGIKKPTIVWTFVGIGSEDISSISMTIDGLAVQAEFRDDLNSVVYTPAEGLASGYHSVSIIVMLDGGIRISCPSFGFNIETDAYEEVPDTPLLYEARDRINYYRKLAALVPVKFNKSLNKAAYNHSLYLTGNTRSGHYENNKSDPYYSGKFPWDRTRYFGYFSPMVGENIHFMEGHILAVDDWMDSLYHRLPIINPVFTDMGYGYSSQDGKHYNVLDMGAPSHVNVEYKTVVYPVDGQSGVPVTWSGLEDPDPFRLYPEAEGPGGYPITLSISRDGIDRIEIVSASLLEGIETEIPFFVFDAQNDPFLKDNNTVALIPENALRIYTEYKVKINGLIKYTNGGEQEFSKEWSFSTGGGELETYDYDAQLKVYFNGVIKEYEPVPFIENARVLIPVRSFCEELGALVRWDGETYTVEIIKEDQVITFAIGSRWAFVNDKQIEMDVPAAIYGDRTFVPLRFVSEALGFDVKWDRISRSVLIYSR